MPQTLACPHCQGSVGVADEDLGFHVTCPHCQVDFLAPAFKPAGAANPSLGSASSTSTPESDEDDWLQLDEKPLSPQPKVNRDDEILAQYMVSDQDPQSSSSSSTSSSSSSSSSAGSDGFDDLELPDFVDNLPSPTKPKTANNPAADNKPKPAIKKEELKEYRVTCKTCGTPTYVKAKQAGRTIKCADCHSSITVPPPPKVRKAPAPMPEAKALPMQQSANANRRPAPFQKSAERLLAEAEAAEVETPPPNYDTPDVAAWFRSVFGIFTDSGVLVHWLAFSMIAAIPTYIAIRSEQTILIGALFPFAAIIGSLIAACGFAIMESVANQEDSVSSWPVFEPFAWLGQLFLVAAAAAVPLVPVAAVFGFLIGPSLLLVLVGLFAVYALFPFVLLSMMDMDSPFVPFSAEVARSVTRCQEPWGGLYFSSGILFFALFLLIASMTTMAGDSGLIISITATVGVIFIYFAMIGRLAYAIGQSDES
ncbi:hypothetical protein LF1_39360 [Rubripirellula obstinata]|uniref:Uncharacterized protein n=1 Tax=Rubripirellula obstinata TaxID=406547 RepID=A0A5B1CNL3_9BACT|nr:hypothetical protein [Rubripirellula obstinata]KAA1261389.1 hypothetical protein LF1_39360 [Rubripirellula obstinata]